MLYDILSPLIFFLSLGGILLIIGRVVIRIRREQFSDSLTSLHPAGTSSRTLGATFGTREVSNILRPNQKSVHVITSRLSVWWHGLLRSGTEMKRWSAARRERREQAALEKQAAVTTSEAAPTSAETTAAASTDAVLTPDNEAIVTPPVTSRLRRLRFWARPSSRDVSQPTAETRPGASSVPLSDGHMSSRRHWRLRRIKRRVGQSEQAPAALTDEVPSAQPVPSTSPRPADHLVAGSRGKEASLESRSNSLLRRQRAGTGNAVLDRAKAILAEANFRQAEDMLVPYIVKHPKDTVAYMLLGQAAVGRHAWLEAMEIYEQVVVWNAAQEGAYAALGYAALRAGRFTRALEALQRAHEADPADPAILTSLLSIAQKMDNQPLQHSITEKLNELKQSHPHAETHATRARV